MKKYLMLKTLLFGCISLFTTSTYGQRIYDLMDQDGVNLEEVQQEAKTYFDSVGRGKGTGYKLFKRWEHHAYSKLQEDGTILSREATTKAIKESKISLTNKSSNTYSASNWTEIGPLTIASGNSGTTPGNGRLTAIYIEPVNQQLIYAGSPGGGLWKSINGGSSWSPIGDQFENMSIWSVTCDPSNTDVVYYGDQLGQVFKSTDGGANFTKILDETGAVLCILINPNDSNEIFASMKNKGLFHSTNGGTTWTQVITGGTIEDIKYKPGSTTTIYACGNDFYKSDNGGGSFTQITNGISYSGRMRLDVTPANNNYVYIAQAKGSGFGYLYKSTDSGNSFTIQTDRASSGDIVGVQASRNLVIAVSDTNAEEVHAGGFTLYKSVDGGVNFTQETSWLKSFIAYPYLHADQEDAFFVDGNMYVGTDGGLSKSTDNGASFTNLSVGLGIQQLYSVSSSLTDKNVVAGAAQDNGPVIKFGETTLWRHWSSGDGVSCAVDPMDANTVYSCTQYGGLLKTTTKGVSKVQNLIVPPENNAGQWVTPIAVDETDNKRVYVGYKDLYRHNNSAINGTGWVNLSSGAFSYKLKHVDLCPSDENTVYVVSYKTLFKSTNILSATPTWTGYPQSLYINDIAVDPYDSNRVVLAASNGAVKLTTDGAETWTDISEGLPDVAIQAAVLDRSSDQGIYVAIDGAVYYKSNTVTTWTLFSENLPNVDITKLDLYYGATGESRIRVATYGRGVWESPLYDDSDVVLSVDNPELERDTVVVYPNPVSTTLYVQLATPEGDIVLSVFSLSGAKVLENSFKTHKGLNLLKLDIENLKPGVYILNMDMEGTKTVKRFIVE
ncbi:MAG: T9SS type A sorting domain-containing protein [Winogradskyella arenosi]